MDIPDKDQIIADIRRAAAWETNRAGRRTDQAGRGRGAAPVRPCAAARELDAKYQPEPMQAEVDKLVAERVKTSVEGAFAAVGGAQLANMPWIAAVADAILERSGWRPPVPAGVDPTCLRSPRRPASRRRWCARTPARWSRRYQTRACAASRRRTRGDNLPAQ